ncbi:MAG TPA: D-Ala-D-Ala carboxypeptidase family metallohydrolase [Methylomirabilota bacterium]|nr:D-Ala-D-Ala carboxypeptidase family metallohydrolase [Methylomirabilota bacterium]
MECFPPALQSILKDLGTQFGQPVVVTSGHRGAGRARRGSQHRACAAADIRIPGVSAGSIAKYARAHAKVGGVGTYCGRRTGLVHVDIGPRRSWHHCGRRRS